MLDSFLIILPIIICILVGYCLKVFGILTKEGAKQMGSLVFWVATPCLLFRMTYTLKLESLSHTRFFLVFYSCLIFSLLCVQLINLLRHCDNKRKATSCMMSIRSNSIFMGIPTVIMLWGDGMLGTLGVFMAFAQTGIVLIGVISSLVVLYGGLHADSIKYAFRSFIRNPVVLGVFAGLIWGLCIGITLPKSVDLSLKILGGIGTGLALMALGTKLEPKRVVADLISTWPDSLIRLIIVPLIVWLGFKIFSTPSPNLEKVAILIMSMPVATNTFPMAEAMGMDGDYAAQSVMATTLLSIFTMPIIAKLLLK